MGAFRCMSRLRNGRNHPHAIFFLIRRYILKFLLATHELMTLFLQNGDRRELEKKAKEEGRLPPGQSLTLKWPVLHYGSVPRFDEANWDFRISGEVTAPVKLFWKEFRALPQTE